MADFLLGKDAKLYYGAEGAAIGALVELDNVGDVTVNLEAGEADVTTRANGGWEGTAATLRKCTIDFEMVWKPADAAFTALKAAFLASTLVEIAALDQDKAVGGAQGPKGSFSVTGFSRNEALTEAIRVSVSVKLTTFDEWVSI